MNKANRQKKCQNCGKRDDRPQIFKGLPYCSDNCRKALARNPDLEVGRN